MTTLTSPSPERSSGASAVVTGRAKRRPGDVAFSGASLFAGIMILAILAAVVIFLVAQAIPALTTPADQMPVHQSFFEYVAPFAFGTVWASFLALIVAVPLSVGIALFISHYAPRRFAQLIGYVIDLLSAIPSIVYGLWGIAVLAPMMQPVMSWLAENLGWLPFFAGQPSGTGRTMLTAAMVLAIMVLPIITALCREVFLQTPELNEHAALALGATRWEMIRMSVLPFGGPGIVAAAMLGLGRALGETMAIAMVLSPAALISWSVIGSSNPNTIAANIAQTFPEASGNPLMRSLLIGSGLVLFVITLFVNSLGRIIVNRTTAKQKARPKK